MARITRTRLTLIAVGALTVFLTGTPAATPLTSWEGQWNPSVRLDAAQVQTRDLAPGMIDHDRTGLDSTDTVPESDCWDAYSCLRTEYALPPEYDTVDALPGLLTDADGAEHAECYVIVADTSVVFCADGYSEVS